MKSWRSARFTPRTFRWRAVLTALGGLAGVAVSAAEPDQRAGAAPKTHTLFMGVDIAVQEAAEYYRVSDVSGGSFVIYVKGRPVFVAMTGRPVTMRVDQSLKLSRLSAELANLKGERAYTLGHDPRIRRSREQASLTIALSDARTNAEVKMINAANNAAHRSNDPGAPSEAQLNSAANVAAQNLANVTNQLSATTDGRFFAKRLEEDLAKEEFDAMEVNFEVSSPSPLNDPYIVVITRYREPDAKAGTVRNWIYAKSLEPIDENPRKVHVLQGGFPPGFVLEDFQVHLYDRGQEVATNVAPKRVPLSANEAMLYLMIEHLAAHKNDTVPASLALTTLPPDFQRRLAQGEGRQPLWVKVSTEGRITEAYLDEDRASKLENPALLDALREIRYKPAIEKGRVVESVVRLKLGDVPPTI